MDSQSSQLSSLSRSSSQTPATFGHSEFSQEETSSIANKLNKKLGKDHTASRVGAGNSRFTYIESWKLIQLANQIFSFNGWSCSIVDISPDYIEESKGRFTVGVTAVVRITLKDGTMHEDVGYGMSENPRKGAAIELAKKEAVSDARKRALRLFGDSLGNCLYDKSHLKRIKTPNGSTGEDILDGTSQTIAMPNMTIKDEPMSKMEHHDEEENVNPLTRAPVCAMEQARLQAQNNTMGPNKIPPKMNNNMNNGNNNSNPAVNRFQPYPKPMMNNNNNNNNNGNMMNNGMNNNMNNMNNNNGMNNNNNGSFPPKPAGPQMSRPMNGNAPFKPMMNGGNNAMNGGNNLNMSNNNLNNRSSPPQVVKPNPNFISPSPMIGNEEEEQYDNLDFNAIDQAGNNIQVAN